MTLNFRRVGVPLVLLLLTGLLAGCPGTDAIKSANGELEIRVEFINYDVGRARGYSDDTVGDITGGIPPDQASINMSAVTMLPTDADALAALGSTPLDLLTIAQDLFPTDPDPFTINAPLTAGTYTLSKIQLNELFLFDGSDSLGGTGVNPAWFPDPMNPTCRDFVQVVLLPPVTLTNFGGTPITTVEPSTTSTMTLTVDMAALITAIYDSHSNCTCPGTNCVANFNPNNPATWNCQCQLSGFNDTQFRAASPTYISVQ